MTSQTEFERKVARAAALKAQAKANIEEANQLLDSLDLHEIRAYPAGRYILELQRNATFSAPEAKKNLTPEEYASILKPTPNAALAKALLDDRYVLCQKEGEPKRIIKEVEDEE